jgi:hypothetical protein
VARRAQDRVTLLTSLYDLGLARQAQGDLADAARHLQDGLALAAQAGDETSAAYYLEVLAAVAGQQDSPQRAVRLFAAARSILQTRGCARRKLSDERLLAQNIPELRPRRIQLARHSSMAEPGPGEAAAVAAGLSYPGIPRPRAAPVV